MDIGVIVKFDTENGLKYILENLINDKKIVIADVKNSRIRTDKDVLRVIKVAGNLTTKGKRFDKLYVSKQLNTEEIENIVMPMLSISREDDKMVTIDIE